jgi:hypothetical protein
MKRLRDLVGRELVWTQPHATRRGFVLTLGDETVATLNFRSTWGTLAIAETADGNWTFKRVGFWMPHVTVRAGDAEKDLATFTNSTWTGGGTLVWADGKHLRANTNLWASTFEFKDESEEPLVRFTRIRGVFHMASNVEILAAGAKLPELALLVTLGWYLAVKMHDDAAGGGAAAAAAAG